MQKEKIYNNSWMEIWIYSKNENTKKEALLNGAGCNGTEIVGAWPHGR